MAGHSARSLPASAGSRSAGGMVIENGIRCRRRRMASSTLRRLGLWLPADQQLELRDVLEEVLPHEARGHLVAAGQRFDARLGPAAALLGLDGAHQAGAAQHGELGRVPLDCAVGEGLDRRRSGVVAEDTGYGVDEDALAVGAGAVGEGEDLLVCAPGEHVAAQPPEVADELGVAAGDAVQEGVPRRRGGGAIGRDSRDLRQAVGGIVRSAEAGLQMDHARRRVEQHRVDVPLLDRGRQPAIGLRHALDRGDGPGRGQVGGDATVRDRGRAPAADAARLVEGEQRAFLLPAPVAVAHPGAPARDVAQEVGVQRGEVQGQRVVRIRGRVALQVEFRPLRSVRAHLASALIGATMASSQARCLALIG